MYSLLLDTIVLINPLLLVQTNSGMQIYYLYFLHNMSPFACEINLDVHIRYKMSPFEMNLNQSPS